MEEKSSDVKRNPGKSERLTFIFMLLSVAAAATMILYWMDYWSDLVQFFL